MAYNLAQAFVEIVPSMQGVGKAISNAFGDAAKTTGGKAGKDMGTALNTELGGTIKTGAGKIGGMLKGVGVAALGVAAAAGAGLTAIGKQALGAYATYEQAVGGVDTLFKDSSKTVQKYAADAYKTAGVSANDYMNQVTSFAASLVSSLGGDTAASAESANTALVDMSDNANKMGTDLGSLQWAYQGFAKQNYTMLDNLKLGYGGTKEEMQRLIDDANKLGEAQGKSNDLSIDSFADVVEAIHRVQENLNITGTTSREAATTIEGSIGMMKASWTNWLTELGKNDADMKGLTSQLVQSVITVGKNVAPRVAQIAAGIVSGVSAAIGEVATYLPQPVQAGIAKIQGVLGSFTGFLSGWSDKAKALFDIFKTGDFTAGFATAFNVSEDSPLVDMILRIRDTAMQVTGSVPGMFANMVGRIKNVFGGIIGIVQQVAGAFSNAFTGGGGTLSGLMTVVSTLMSLTSPLGVAKLLFTQFGDQLSQIAANAIPQLVSMLTTVASILGGTIAALLPGIQSVISSIVPVIAQIITLAGGLVTSILPIIAMGLQQLASVVMQFMPILTQIAQLIARVLSVVAPLIAQLVSALMPVIQNIMAAVMNLVTALMPAISGLASIATGIIQFIISGLQLLIPIVQMVLSVVVSVVSGIISAIGLVISTVVNIVAVIAGVVANIISVLGVVVTTIGNTANVVASVFGVMLSTVANIVSAIAAAISNAFQIVVNVITTAVNAAGAVITGFQALISSAFNAISGVVSSVMGAVGGAVRNAANILQSAFGSMVSAASSMAGRLMSLIGSIPGRIKGFFASAGSWLVSAGSNIIAGLWNGISGAIGGLYSKITGALSGLVDKAKAALGIHSPSRVFRDQIGQNIGLGLAQGIDESAKYASRSMGSMMDGLMPDINDLLPANRTYDAATMNRRILYAPQAPQTSGMRPTVTQSFVVNANDPQLVAGIVREDLRRAFEGV